MSVLDLHWAIFFFLGLAAYIGFTGLTLNLCSLIGKTKQYDKSLHLDPYEIGYLYSGPAGAVSTAMTFLEENNLASIDGDSYKSWLVIKPDAVTKLGEIHHKRDQEKKYFQDLELAESLELALCACDGMTYKDMKESNNLSKPLTRIKLRLESENLLISNFKRRLRKVVIVVVPLIPAFGLIGPKAMYQESDLIAGLFVWNILTPGMLFPFAGRNSKQGDLMIEELKEKYDDVIKRVDDYSSRRKVTAAEVALVRSFRVEADESVFFKPLKPSEGN